MVRPGCCQFADAIDLLVGQWVGQHQPDQGKQVAARFGIAQVGHAFAAQAETPPGIGPGGNLKYQHLLQGGDVNFTAGNGGKDIDRHVNV